MTWYYQCCEHCDRDEKGVCQDSPESHEVPCDRSGPHLGCVKCDCTPCGGSKRVSQ